MKHYAIVCFEGDVKVLKRYFEDRAEALKALRAIPGARMMVLNDEHDVPLLPPTLPAACEIKRGTTREKRSKARGRDRDRHADGVTINYDGKHDRAFLQAIEAGEHAKVLQMIVSYPGLIINHLHHPRIYNSRGENALHVAAKCGHSQICSYILESVGSSMYIMAFQGKWTAMTEVIRDKLVELYLNAPERHRYETPLHLASQHGWESVVRVLIAYPQCEFKPNIWGHYPQHMICISATGDCASPEVMSSIALLLQENYFVPLVRTESDLEPPYVGELFTRRQLPDPNHPSRGILAPRRRIKAFAGPMTLAQAQTFRKMWHTSPRLSVYATNASSQTGQGTLLLCVITNQLYEKSQVSQTPAYIIRAFRKRHLDNALEQVGRCLAQAFGIQWKEYWDFLSVFCNLCDSTGLYMLETYLAYIVTNSLGEPDDTSVAIGVDIKNRENLFALCAISTVEINEQLYPTICRWKRYLLSIIDAENMKYLN